MNSLSFLQSAHFTGTLRGLLLQAQLQQRFHNPGTEPVELHYTFPLPWQAVLLEMVVTLDGQVQRAQIQARAQAEQTYEEALADGDHPSLLEANEDLTHTMSLGRLQPGALCVVNFRYTQILDAHDDGLRLSIPTVIAPRYEDADAPRRPPHREAYPDLQAEHGFTFELSLEGGLAQARVSSPTHALGSHWHAESASLVVSLSEATFLDRDLVIRVQTQQRSVVLVGNDAVHGPTAHAVIAQLVPDPEWLPQTVFAQSQAADKAANARSEESSATSETSKAKSEATKASSEPGAVASVGPARGAMAPITLQVLMDCSGSMAGDSLESARQGLSELLEQLQPTDRFSFSRFGSDVEHDYGEVVLFTPSKRRFAEDCVRRLQADLGGTDLDYAIASTLDLAEGEPTQLLLITDGQIEDIDSVLETVQSAKTRVFVVGVGSSVEERHLRRLAQASGGAFEAVAPHESVSGAIRRMMRRLRSPVLSDLRVQWPAGVQVLWQSPLPDHVFAGDAVRVFARCVGTLDAVPSLQTGTSSSQGLGDSPLQADRVAPHPIPLEHHAGDAVARRVAFEHLSDLQDEERLAEALRYQLICDATSAVLVHASTDPSGVVVEPVQQTVRPMLPAGWGGTARVQDTLGPYDLPCTSASSPESSMRFSLAAPREDWGVVAEPDAPQKPAPHDDDDDLGSVGIINARRPPPTLAEQAEQLRQQKPKSPLEFAQAAKRWLPGWVPKDLYALWKQAVPEAVVDWLACEAQAAMPRALCEAELITVFVVAVRRKFHPRWQFWRTPSAGELDDCVVKMESLLGDLPADHWPEPLMGYRPPDPSQSIYAQFVEPTH